MIRKRLIRYVPSLLAMVCSSVVCSSVVCPSAAIAQTVQQQPYVWKSVTVRAGGYIPGIEFSPVKKNLCYCRTDIGGPYKWDESQHRWVPLLDWCPTYNYFGCESIAPDPMDAAKVYIACGMYGRDNACIMRSADEGKTFQITEVPFKMGGNENGRGQGERLAVDPNDTNILYFGSRHDGLWQSTDGAVTWKKVDSFPVKNGGSGGLSFVLFNTSTGHPGAASSEIYVGNTQQGFAGLFKSADAGKTWSPVDGQPPERQFPTHAEMDAQGIIYLSYSNSIPPSGASDGGVWTLNSKSNQWTNISPMIPNVDGHPAFGYGNVVIDRQHPGTAICSTIQRDSKAGGDDLYRTTDNGKTWKSVNQTAGLEKDRDVSAMPYLHTLANPVQWFGWWMTAIAIDPFDSNHACYGTGATIYNTDDLTQMDHDQPTHWNTWVEGIEETAALYLNSPTDGPRLYSCFGDIGGFVHTDLDQTPTNQFLNPKFGNGQAIEYAGANPRVVVRNGTPSGQGSTPYGYSEDFGATWQPLPSPAVQTPTPTATPSTTRSANGNGRNGGRARQVGLGEGSPSLIVSADGNTFMLLAPTAQITSDRGKTWKPVVGLPPLSRVVPDPVNAKAFYAVNLAAKQLLSSNDGGETFTASPVSGLPDMPANNGGRGGSSLRLVACFDRAADLWLVGGKSMLHSTDGGKSFAAISSTPNIAGGGRCFGLGMAAPGKNYPSLFVAGNVGGVSGMFRSDDVGETWVRINDDQHQYGLGFTCVAGDPRVYGRMYIGFNGRGILYADIAK